MSSELFVSKELVRSLNAKAWLLSLAAVGLVALLSGVLALASLLIQPRSGEIRLIAMLRANISEEEINELHRRLLAEPEVLRSRYVLAPASIRSSGHFEISVKAEANLDGVMARLRSWGAFQEISSPASDSIIEELRAALLAPKLRWLVLAALAALLGSTLLVIYAALAKARQGFVGELELLVLSGASPRTMQFPFVLLGALYGLAGALLVELILYGAQIWMDAALISPEALAHLGIRGFLLGLILAGLGGGLGRLVAQRYPSPLSRSRMSSSSAGVGEH